MFTDEQLESLLREGREEVRRLNSEMEEDVREAMRRHRAWLEAQENPERISYAVAL